MTTSRRDFLAGAALTGAALGLGKAASAATAAGAGEKKKTLLILGGTSFVGPHVVERATELGYRVTLFNRGKTNPNLFPELEKLRGDRDPRKGDGLKALEGRSFDAVVDTSGFFPRMVQASAKLLAPNVGHYVFVSSISVYPEFAKIGITEDDPVGTMEDPTLETFGDQFQYYGPLKALCEQAAERALPGRSTSVRPGLIVGPRDNVPRFTYWPVRVERGGEVLSPGDPFDPVQYIDARDLAAFIVNCIEKSRFGVYNASGPTSPTNIAEVLYGAKAVTGGDVRFTWADAAFLEEQKVGGWSDMPLWMPPEGEYAGFHRMDLTRAIDAGLSSRPLAETVRDTLTWFHAWPEDKPFPWRGGMPPEREAEVLAAWHAGKVTGVAKEGES